MIFTTFRFKVVSLVFLYAYLFLYSMFSVFLYHYKEQASFALCLFWMIALIAVIGNMTYDLIDNWDWYNDYY